MQQGGLMHAAACCLATWKHSTRLHVYTLSWPFPQAIEEADAGLQTQVFCGITSRVWQFSDILLDAKQHQQRQQKLQHNIQGVTAEQQHQQGEALQHATSSSSIPSQDSSNPPPAAASAAAAAPCCQAILGDLNTMAHSVARLSPNYCCDALRWRSLGSSEAAWWQRYVLSVMGKARFDAAAAVDVPASYTLCVTCIHQCFGSSNSRAFATYSLHSSATATKSNCVAAAAAVLLPACCCAAACVGCWLQSRAW
jgi:hypothetical protein